MKNTSSEEYVTACFLWFSKMKAESNITAAYKYTKQVNTREGQESLNFKHQVGTKTQLINH